MSCHWFWIRALELMDTNGGRVGGAFIHDQREIDQRARLQAIKVFAIANWKIHRHRVHVAGNLATGNSKGMMSPIDLQNHSKSGAALGSPTQWHTTPQEKHW
jgi:hypothetical protein